MRSASQSRTSASGMLGIFFLATILVAIYWSGLHGGFFFDDEANILLVEGIRMEQFSFESFKSAMASGHSGFSGRSVAQLSFALNYYFSGFNPFAFKVTNLAIHATNGFLVFLLARRLLGVRSPSYSESTLIVTSSLVAAMWLLHPIQLTSVLLVVQRMTSLSALFLLSALLLHLRGRECRGAVAVVYLILASCIFWPLSFFSKDTGALFPFFVVAWELIVRRATIDNLDRFACWLTAAIGLVVLLGAGYALSSAGKWLWAGYDYRNFSLLERLLTEGRVLWFYLGLIVLPNLEALGLYHDDLIISQSLFSPWTTLAALIGLFGLVGLVWRFRNTAPLVSFGLAWFLIGHGLESTILPLEIAHEHRNYLPLFGIVIAGVAALLPVFDRAGWRRTLGIALAALALIYCSLITTLRSHQFGDDVRRTQIEAQHHRGSARAQYEAGQVFSRVAETTPKESPIHDLARRHFEMSMELDPTFKIGGLGLIYMDCLAGEHVGPRWIDELSSRLRNTPFAPGDTAILYSLKELSLKEALCLERKDVDSLFTSALENPRISQGIQAKLYSWQADYLWLNEHDLSSARIALGKSLALNPASPSNRLKWAQLTLLGGETLKARKLLEELRGQGLSAKEQETLNDLLMAIQGSKQ